MLSKLANFGSLKSDIFRLMLVLTVPAHARLSIYNMSSNHGQRAEVLMKVDQGLNTKYSMVLPE